MKKVVLNGCYGGFSLSKEGTLAVLKRKGIEVIKVEEDRWGTYTIHTPDEKYSSYYDFERYDEDLVAVVEELGEKANGSHARLFIDEYDDENFTYYIDEYDGFEHLELIPVVSEKRLAECRTTSEIVEYLRSLDILVKTA